MWFGNILVAIKVLKLNRSVFAYMTFTRKRNLFAGAGLQPAPHVFSIEERSNCNVRKIQKSKKRLVQFTKLNPHLFLACHARLDRASSKTNMPVLPGFPIETFVNDMRMAY